MSLKARVFAFTLCGASLAFAAQAFVTQAFAADVVKLAIGQRGLTAKKTAVVPGVNDGGFVEIRSGLKAGDRVVADGLNRVQDGRPVTLAGAGGPARKAG